jgi:hypothetical protein
MIEGTRGNFGSTIMLKNNTLQGQVLFLFMLRNIKCESMVDTVWRKESNVLNCNGNTFCLIAGNIVKITFVN